MIICIFLLLSYCLDRVMIVVFKFRKKKCPKLNMPNAMLKAPTTIKAVGAAYCYVPTDVNVCITGSFTTCASWQVRLQTWKKKKLYLDKHILKPFVPVAKNIFFLETEKKNEYPLLTTKADKTLKYVGSLNNSNVLRYDPFLKIPTKKLASHFLSEIEPPKLPSDLFDASNA